MRLRARYRREVVEEILDIKVFTQMALLLRIKNQELTKNVLEIKHKCDLLDEKYNLEKKHFETIKNKNENILYILGKYFWLKKSYLQFSQNSVIKIF